MDQGSQWYHRFLEGDESAFVEIVREYKDALILFLNRMVQDFCVAEDLAEDTFALIGVKRPHFSERSSFKTWLYAIGRNRAIDFLRKRAKNHTVSLEEAAETADEAALEEEFLKKEERANYKRCIYQAMDQLKPSYRQVLWLFYFEDFSNKEIAGIMKKSVHGIESLKYRAGLALKKELEREGFEYERL